MNPNLDTKKHRALLEINMYALHEEWSNQPLLFHEYAVYLEEARLELEEAKNALSLVEVQTGKKVRAEPQRYGLVKVTEAAIKEAVARNKEVVAAISKIDDCRYNVGILQAMVSSLEQRKRALEKLVDLHGQDYFSQPIARNDKLKQSSTSEVRQRVKSKIKQR